MSRVAVFLDRDGTINEDPGYLHAPEQLRLYPGAAQAIARLNRHGFLVVLVTNQAGIARGYYTTKEFFAVQERMAELLRQEQAHLDAIYYCPHHPDGVVEPYRGSCSCRKPAPGMVLQAASELNIHLAQSYLVGDQPSDIAAGTTAGCRTVQVGILAGDSRSAECRPTYVAPDLAAAVSWILQDDTARPSTRGEPS